MLCCRCYVLDVLDAIGVIVMNTYILIGAMVTISVIGVSTYLLIGVIAIRVLQVF